MRILIPEPVFVVSPIPDSMKNPADPGPTRWDSISRGCNPWSRPFLGLWSLMSYTSLRPCYFIKCMILYCHFTPITNKTKISTETAATKKALLISSVPNSWTLQAEIDVTWSLYKFQLDSWFSQLKYSNKRIEFKFAGINISWPRLWLILARSVKQTVLQLLSLYLYINCITIIITLEGIEKIKTEKIDNKTPWEIFLLPTL